MSAEEPWRDRAAFLRVIRQVALNRRVEIQLAVLVQLPDGHRGHRLGRAADPELRRRRVDRYIEFDVCVAVAGRPSAPVEERNRHCQARDILPPGKTAGGLRGFVRGIIEVRQRRGAGQQGKGKKGGAGVGPERSIHNAVPG